MGKSTTPKYRLRLADAEPMIWDIKAFGRPTAVNLERFVMAHAKSLQPGGANAHLSEHLGYVPYPYKATIELNCAGPVTVVEEWRAAMFQVYGEVPA